MKTSTVLQDHLVRRTLPVSLICQRLATERTAIYRWASGLGYPNRLNAGELIQLFAEHGVELDYNDIYQQKLENGHWDVAV